jgi:hypothetical protein
VARRMVGDRMSPGGAVLVQGPTRVSSSRSCQAAGPAVLDLRPHRWRPGPRGQAGGTADLGGRLTPACAAAGSGHGRHV